jgi:hypothetical protein
MQIANRRYHLLILPTYRRQALRKAGIPLFGKEGVVEIF